MFFENDSLDCSNRGRIGKYHYARKYYQQNGLGVSIDSPLIQVMSIIPCINMFGEDSEEIIIPTSASEENVFVNCNVIFPLRDGSQYPNIIFKLHELAPRADRDVTWM